MIVPETALVCQHTAYARTPRFDRLTDALLARTKGRPAETPRPGRGRPQATATTTAQLPAWLWAEFPKGIGTETETLFRVALDLGRFTAHELAAAGKVKPRRATEVISLLRTHKLLERASRDPHATVYHWTKGETLC